MIIFVPGFVTAIITFPGVILHEIAHKFFCDLYQVPVYKVNYFVVSSKAGSVVHAVLHHSRKNAIIALAPLLINSMICLLFLTPQFLSHFMGTSFISTYTIFDFILIWIGISCGFNALPSKADIAHIDARISWQLRCIKIFVKILNFFGVVGNFIWLAILFLIFCLICLPILLIFSFIAMIL